LIDKEFVTNNRAAFDSKALTGKTGAYVGQTGGVMGRLLDAKKGDPVFQLVGTKYPVLKKGDTPFIGQRDNPINGMGLAITSKAKNPALAAQWADYAYGPEGHMLFNFGIEGESYTMVDGFPTYTDLVRKHPNGIQQALATYNRATYNGPIVQDERHIVQYLDRPQQRDALAQWSRTRASESKLPAITPSPEESRRFAAIMNEVNVYTEEMFIKFILGVEPLSNFDAYVAQVKRMNIDEAIAIQTAALARYNLR
jgi:putative aldouronate transport system substrate-binding protein